MGKKTPKPAPEVQATQFPLERIRAAQMKLTEITTATADVVRDIEAANIALISEKALQRLNADSLLDPLASSDQVDAVINALTEAEDLAKSNAGELREAGKLAEHLQFAVRSLYREVLARGDRERASRLEKEAARQTTLFPPAQDQN